MKRPIRRLPARRLGAAGALLAAWACAAPAAGAAAARAAGDDWEETLDRIVPAVVALRVSAARSFDTAGAGVSNATGFVVDAAHGLILTNRHVVGAGPVTAEAVFLDHEKVELQPLYRDPVHDFGFFRFDPSDLRFMRLREVELAPQRARVGLEIRVIGNDAGEKLSILDGTLARLDREAPRYGSDGYNDFDTFYYQAASSTSGGSSGSPVVDRSGRAVALNAGAASNSSASFFLPLDRVVRALERLRAGQPVTRGTLQAVFRHEPFDELRRLGLRAASETAARRAAPDLTGLLVVAETVPGGPAHGRLEPGDVLLRLGGRSVFGFTDVEALLDESVGRPLRVEVERGGEPLAVDLAVGDLHALAPDRYLEAGGGILHELSYQQARNFGVPVAGVYVAEAGYALERADVPRLARIDAVGGVPTPDLDGFEARLAAFPDGAAVALRYVHLANPRAPRVALLHVDRHWFPMRSCRRDDAAGLWQCRDSPPAPPAPPRQPLTTDFAVSGPRAARALAPSLAFVEFAVPAGIDGAHGRSFQGTGLVLDAERGLVVVDRDTVPVSLGDLTLGFAGSVSIPGRVVALHPEHNLALVAYDPLLLGDTPVRSAKLRLDPLGPGAEIWQVGLTPGQQVVSRRTEVARLEPTLLPLPGPPRFRESNLERVVPDATTPTVGGVLADGAGRVRALWLSFSSSERGEPRSFFSGMPIEIAAEMLETLRSEGDFHWRTLGAEFEPIPIAQARERGLAAEAARALEEHDPERRQVLMVRRVAADAAAAAELQGGDLLLSVNGTPATHFREVERAAQAPRLALRVLRDGRELALDLETTALDGVGTRRALVWAGALLQPPPRALATDWAIPRQGVYVAGGFRGSPADHYRLATGLRILAVDGRPTPDLESFLAAVSGRPDRASLRLLTEDLERKTAARTLELDLHYFPTFDLLRNEDGWIRRP